MARLSYQVIEHVCLASAGGSGDMLADRQTDTHTYTHTDVLITTLRHRSGRRSSNSTKTKTTKLSWRNIGYNTSC